VCASAAILLGTGMAKSLAQVGVEGKPEDTLMLHHRTVAWQSQKWHQNKKGRVIVITNGLALGACRAMLRGAYPSNSS